MSFHLSLSMEPHINLKKNELRQNAEAQFRQKHSSVSLPESSEEMQHLFYELQVHQIELEMQKEELETVRQDLANANTQLRALLSAIPVPINVTRAGDGKLLYNNPKFQEFFGLSSNLNEQPNADSLYLLPEERQTLLEELNAGGKVDNYETILKTSANEERWVLSSMRKITFEGEEATLSAIINISDRKKAEQESNALNQTLEERVEERTRELKVLINEKNEFLGLAAHDLKNPLSSILTGAEILKRNMPENALVQRFSTSVTQAGNHMMDIITKLLDVNRIEQGLVSLKIQPTSLKFIENIVQEYLPRAAQKGIIIHYSYPKANSIGIFADEQAAKQIFDNLLSNAVKYSPHWKHIRVRTLVRQESEAEVVRIEVQDEGPGLSWDDQEKLFGKFARLSARPTSGENSTGLGLSIVKKLVELQNGRVWCESVHGQGATFIVELPSAILPNGEISAISDNR